MAAIEKAFPLLLLNEGGYVNNVHDHGGPTNFGVTQADFAQYMGRSVSADDVRHMTVDQAKEIYKKHYWSVNSLDQVNSQAIATCIFDMGVLCGTNTAAKWAQEIAGCTADGKIGPASVEALNKCTEHDFTNRFANRAQAYFNNIAARHPSQHGFLRGWTERVDRLRKLHSEADVKSVPPKEVSGNYAAKVLSLADSVACGALASRMLSFMGSHEPRYVSIFDVSKPDTAKRLHILDTQNMSVQSITCGVGKNTDPDHSGHAVHFSNEPGSQCTSLGVFRYSEITHSDKHGSVCRLDGLESTNSNMRSRAVILHTASYVTDQKAGRTEGCEGIAMNHADVIQKLANGSFGIIGKA